MFHFIKKRTSHSTNWIIRQIVASINYLIQQLNFVRYFDFIWQKWISPLMHEHLFTLQIHIWLTICPLKFLSRYVYEVNSHDAEYFIIKWVTSNNLILFLIFNTVLSKSIVFCILYYNEMHSQNERGTKQVTVPLINHSERYKSVHWRLMTRQRRSWRNLSWFQRCLRIRDICSRVTFSLLYIFADTFGVSNYKS